MSIAAMVVVAVSVFLTVAFVIALFVWGAVKDGQEDKAIQARLGIRRRTRLGR
jgi:heme/copper-type cytochrome/quinol oxidase subunit 2